MQNLPAAPELRSPQLLLRKLRRKTACIGVAVVLVLVLSICALLYAIARDPGIALQAAGTLA